MQVETAFREKPAVHRFPGSMATRVQDLAALVEEEYGAMRHGSGARHPMPTISRSASPASPDSAT
jgi:hypothetical protein